MQRARRRDMDMTEGSIFKHILMFALPLLVGNIFQQLYNTVDTWVVGNYAGTLAFSAVGTVSPIINMLIGAFSGLASGAGVVISQYYGAGDRKKVHDSVHTAIMLTAILSVVLTAVGLLMINPMLRLMKTPDDVYPESYNYLFIYFCGLTGLLFYNMGAGILRAIGDSRRPFYLLVISAAINIVLDLLFVIAFGMGVRGVAFATIIAQGTSALLIVAILIRSNTWVHLDVRQIRIHGSILKKIVRVGIPAALQMAITSFSNVFVQSYINQFGSACIGGWTAYSKIDQLVFLPMQSLALSSTTFVGQNLGKNQVARAKQGVRTALLMAFAVTALIAIVILLFAPGLVTFFNDDPDVNEYGTLFLRIITPFCVFSCINQVYSGALRGSGDSRATMIIMLSSFVVFRQAYLYIVSNYISNEIIPIAMSYPAGWMVCSLATFIYYHKAQLGKNRLVETQDA